MMVVFSFLAGPPLPAPVFAQLDSADGAANRPRELT